MKSVRSETKIFKDGTKVNFCEDENGECHWFAPVTGYTSENIAEANRLLEEFKKGGQSNGRSNNNNPNN
jgi:hypothetical protein